MQSEVMHQTSTKTEMLQPKILLFKHPLVSSISTALRSMWDRKILQSEEADSRVHFSGAGRSLQQQLLIMIIDPHGLNKSVG